MLLSANRPLITGAGMKLFNSNDNAKEGSHPRVPNSLVWIVGIILLSIWTLGWLAFSSQVHRGWLAQKVDGQDGPMAIHEIITGVMILLGWLFGVGGIGLLLSGRKEKQRRAESPQWMNEVAFCPKCKRKLRTSRAKQCFQCGADWH